MDPQMNRAPEKWTFGLSMGLRTLVSPTHSSAHTQGFIRSALAVAHGDLIQVFLSTSVKAGCGATCVLMLAQAETCLCNVVFEEPLNS